MSLLVASFLLQLTLPVQSFFFFNDTAPTEISPFSLHDALPISSSRGIVPERRGPTHRVRGQFRDGVGECVATTRRRCPQGAFFSGPPEKTPPPARETAGPH